MIIKNIFRSSLVLAAISAFLIGGSTIAFAADSNIALTGTASTSYCSPWETLTAINDGYTPSSSADTSHGQYGNWDNPGTTQWVQYDFAQNYNISNCEVYWFDDDEGIDLPASCSFQYWNGTNWVDFSGQSGKGTAGNTFNKTTFTTAKTNKIRLDVTAKSAYSTGILEWKVWGTPTAASNTAPVVNAGTDVTITLPSTVTLNGTASDDGLPNGTLTKTWSKESGPGTVTFANAASLNTTASFSTAGTYVLKLTVNDGVLASSDTVTITVNEASSGPVVTTPPSWINSFYKKCIMINGIPICTTSAVPDQALINAYYVLDAQLKKIKTDKPAILQRMLDNQVYVIIVGLNETNSMHPSWAGYDDPSWPRRGGGGNPTTVLEEDCIVPTSDTWRQNFCGLVHEFAHTLLTFGIGDAGLAGADPATYNAIVTAYNHAIAANKYTESDYDRGNYHEYFTGQSGRWFNANPTDLNVPNAQSKTDRQQLQEYDPEMYNILSTLYGDYKLPKPWN